MKVYSKVRQLPTGQASEKLVEGCLVLEGGAFRGLYTQGFLDAMMINDLSLSCVIGVSAGALSGASYVSGQIGRSGRINLTYRHDSRYIGTRALIHNHSILDVGFLTEERGILEPLDTERFYRPDQRFIAVATNCRTGRPACFEKGKCSDMMAALRASAAIPFISQMVKIEGVPYLDGACSCRIPYLWALKSGYEKIVVIRTRDREFRKEESGPKRKYHLYRKYPELVRRLANGDHAYNLQCDELDRLHREGRVFMAAPSKTVTVQQLEKDMEKLGDLYWLGYQDCMDQLTELKRYLIAAC